MSAGQRGSSSAAHGGAGGCGKESDEPSSSMTVALLSLDRAPLMAPPSSARTMATGVLGARRRPRAHAAKTRAPGADARAPLGVLCQRCTRSIDLDLDLRLRVV